MADFTKKMFQSESGYKFTQGSEDLIDYCVEELMFQLYDLERLWESVNPEKWKNPIPYQYAIKYQRMIESILFRLKEVIRFIRTTNGPSIVRFVCTELLDIVRQIEIREKFFTKKEYDQIGIVLTSTTICFQKDLIDFGVVSQKQVAQELYTAMQPLLSQYHLRS